MGKVFLAGDIGGTKTHLALFERGDGRQWLIDKKYKSAEYENLDVIVRIFLEEFPGYEIIRACFGIAGPVVNGVCRATNLPWVVDAKALGEKAQIPDVHLINDLEANAYGINCLTDEEFCVLSKGVEKRGSASLISAGTGLGEAGIFFDGKIFHPFASEGGHAGFAPESPIEIALLKYLYKKYDHVSFERILSGPGIYQLYEFLVDEGYEKAIEGEVTPRVITQRAMEGKCAVSNRVLELFVSIYGNEAANHALKMLAVGGVFIGGGIAPKILEKLKSGLFMERFEHKGRFSSLLHDIPVKVILNENTAMLGAAYYARERC